MGEGCSMGALHSAAGLAAGIGQDYTRPALMTETFTSHLDDLLERVCVSLQLTATQYKLARERYEAVGTWLGADESLIAHLRPGIHPQGSLAIGTTVRPTRYTEYDLDLVCELQADWTAVNAVGILDLIETRMKENEIYRPMVERKRRVIRLNYANDFHLDILPALPDSWAGGTCVRVPDRELRAWKPSNPKGYASWFEERAALVRLKIEKFDMAPLPAQESVEAKPPLKRIVQLLKRWRDLAYAADPVCAPISIVLTTLAGTHYAGETSVSEGMMRILDGIAASIPAQGRLVVRNPKNEGEDLSERWDADRKAYEAFVAGIVGFRDEWRRVLQLRGVHAVSEPVEALFGEEVVRAVLKSQAAYLKSLRGTGSLGMQSSTGLLVAAGGPGVTRVEEHRFHGEAS